MRNFLFSLDFQLINSEEDILSSLISLLPLIPRDHRPDSYIYKYLSGLASYASSSLFSPKGKQKASLGLLGEVKLPFFSMGAINSTHLFGLDELILFSFYANNVSRYNKVADLGANIGLHSIVLSKLGYAVTSYEPDELHVKKIEENILLNGIVNNKPLILNKAISNTKGSVEFVRVKGNTTGSHISGAKDSPFGELDKFSVYTDCFHEIISNFDFLKIDVEGHEATILLETSSDHWRNTDAMVEVGTETNAAMIFNHFNSININLFAQKIGWNNVTTIEDMPTSYKEGSLFITNKVSVPW